MDATETETHLNLKILFDKEKDKVLFAEADVDFVSILFSFLTLPLGTIVRLIAKTKTHSEPETLGCLNTMHQSVTSLGNEHFCDEVFKDMLVHPRSSSEDLCRRLKINMDDTEAKYFCCPNYSSCMSTCFNYMSIYKNTKCSYCHSPMGEQYLGASVCSSEVFVAKALKFIVTDDLQVTPVVPGTILSLFNNIGIGDTSAIEERAVKLGMNELLELLKWTWLSTTPLTDLYVVEAGQDFIDFLFSFLTIPLGEMLHIMEGQSCLGSIDGLYKSALSLDSEYFISEGHKNILLRPKLPPNFNRTNHLFPLESTSISTTEGRRTKTMSVNSISIGVEGSGGFLREEAVFFVLDNLEVIPFSAAYAISIFNRKNVSISDGEERTLSIGMAEGVSILRASLNSSSAISDGLLQNNLIFEEPKRERCLLEF